MIICIIILNDNYLCSSSEGSDFEDDLTKYRTPTASEKKKRRMKQILSSDSDDADASKGNEE